MLFFINRLKLWWPRILVYLLPSCYVFYRMLRSFYEVFFNCVQGYSQYSMIWGWNRVFMLLYGAFSIIPQLLFFALFSLPYSRIDAQPDWTEARKQSEKRFRIGALIWALFLPVIMALAHDAVLVVLFLVCKIKLALF